MKKLPKFIVLVGYRSSNGNFVPCFYFDKQDDFKTWFIENDVLTGNLSIFKLSIPLFEDLDSTSKVNITDFIKHSYI